MEVPPAATDKNYPPFILGQQLEFSASFAASDTSINPQTLLDFIKHPENIMGDRSIPEKEQVLIRNWLALEIAKKLVVVPSAYFVHW